MESSVKNIGILTSGGDAPGMNAAIRAVVRTALYYGIQVTEIRRGYEGMIHGEMASMNSQSVANIIQRGGTMLKTARSELFKTVAGRRTAYESLKKHQVDGLVTIGGDGTFAGAKMFGEEFDLPIIGVPGTIDNDLWGTDYTIGYDTAINTVIDAVDKIRDTAESHDRLFIVEVMGRDSGLIALRSGIASGAEAVMIPETKTSIQHVLDRLAKGVRRKESKIIIVSEGDKAGGAFKVGHKIKQQYPKYDIRISVLGHIQRGGSPTCMDRVLASRIGVAAVEALMQGRRNEMIGIVNHELTYTQFDKAIKRHTEIDSGLLRLVEILSL